MKTQPIIDVEELQKIYQNSDVLIFDASNEKNALELYETEHLEGAFLVDVNKQLANIHSDLSIGGRHPLPEVKDFAATLGKLGITPNSHVVIYDHKNGANAAARFWWMLRALGHDKVQVLNGGFNQAKSQNFPMQNGINEPEAAPGPYPANEWKLSTMNLDQVESICEDPDFIIIDVREKARYDGVTEPIDLIAGHIPGAKNYPFSENLDAKGLFRDPDILKEQYQNFLDSKEPEKVVVHCGSGVTACHTLLAMAHAGLEIPKLYVGSWSEWSRNDKTIATSL